MLRKIAALAVGGVLAAAVYAAAATIGNVSDGTAATGSGSVASCGDITGSTYLLYGTGITGQTSTVLINTPSDITKVTRVNIETVTDCININFYVQLKDGGGSNLDGVGFCEVTASGGLGFNELSSGDNVPGCTVDLNVPVNVAAITTLVVTQT
jgi:acetyl-CoA carboxylase carboxyltransferase component